MREAELYKTPEKGGLVTPADALKRYGSIAGYSCVMRDCLPCFDQPSVESEFPTSP